MLLHFLLKMRFLVPGNGISTDNMWCFLALPLYGASKERFSDQRTGLLIVYEHLFLHQLCPETNLNEHF